MYQIDDIGSTFASLPPNLQTVDNECIAYAFDRQIRKFIALAKKVTIWSDLDNADARYYDYMAASIKAPYYLSRYDDERKLKILKSAILVNQYAGTVQAVEQMIESIFTDPKYYRWFEYGGQPYHYRVTVTDILEEDSLKMFLDKLDHVKAIRSVIDAIEVHRDATLYVKSAAEAYSYSVPQAITDGFSVDGADVEGAAYTGGDGLRITCQADIREGLHLESEADAIPAHAGTNATGHTVAAAVTDGFTMDAEPANVSIPAGTTADNGITKTTIKED